MALQPLSHSEWLSGCSSQSAAATQPLCQRGWTSHSATQRWVPEWLRQPLCQSGWSSLSGRVAEWLSGWSSLSGRVAEWLLRFREPCCTSTPILYIWLHCLVGYIDHPEYWWAPIISPYYLVDVPIGIPLYHTISRYPNMFSVKIPISCQIQCPYDQHILKTTNKKHHFSKAWVSHVYLDRWIVSGEAPGGFRGSVSLGAALLVWPSSVSDRLGSSRLQHAGDDSAEVMEMYWLELDSEKCREIILFY